MRTRLGSLFLAATVLSTAGPALAMKGDFSRGHMPDGKRSQPMPQTREHILLGRQVGVPRVLEEWDGSNVLVREVVYGLGTPLWQLLPDGSSQYFHEDPRGNVVALTEGAGSPVAAAGDVLERVTYDPYGKPVFQNAANANKTDMFGVPIGESDLQNTLLFRGLWYDPATSGRSPSTNADFGGWYLFDAQYYNPNTGRHTTRALPDGDPDRPVVTGRAAYAEVLPYAAAGRPPVNTSTNGGHEMGHALGSGGGFAPRAQPTGKRKHGPVYFARKKPGRLKWGPVHLDAGKAAQATPSLPEVDDEVIVVFETARACVLFSPDGTPVRAKGSVGP